MTAIATKTGTARHVSLAAAVQHGGTLAWRSLVKIKSSPEQLLDVTLQPIIFLLLFVYVFGGQMAGNGDTTAYLQFLLPGLLGQGIDIDSAPHVPRERCGVEVVLRQGGALGRHPPPGQFTDNRSESQSGVGEPVAAVGHLDQTGGAKGAQSAAQCGRRDAGDATTDVAERDRPGKHLAYDQQGPPLTDHIQCSCDRAELPRSLHRHRVSTRRRLVKILK